MSLYTDDVQTSHQLAMEAKELILKAQDTIDRAKLPPTATGVRASSGRRAAKTFYNRIARELAKARRALEALDGACREAQGGDASSG